MYIHAISGILTGDPSGQILQICALDCTAKGIGAITFPKVLQYRKLQVMFKVFPANLHTFIDTPDCVLEDRVQYSTVHIPNVFCDVHLQLINCEGIFRIQ